MDGTVEGLVSSVTQNYLVVFVESLTRVTKDTTDLSTTIPHLDQCSNMTDDGR